MDIWVPTPSKISRACQTESLLVSVLAISKRDICIWNVLFIWKDTVKTYLSSSCYCHWHKTCQKGHPPQATWGHLSGARYSNQITLWFTWHAVCLPVGFQLVIMAHLCSEKSDVCQKILHIAFIYTSIQQSISNTLTFNIWLNPTEALHTHLSALLKRTGSKHICKAEIQVVY